MDHDRESNGEPIDLDAEMQREVAEVAKSQGRRPADIVREALDEYFSRHGREPLGPPKSALDRFREAGLLGCVDDLPSDLSTNPKYLEGFGGT